MAPHIALSAPLAPARQTAGVATMTAIAVTDVTTAVVMGYATGGQARSREARKFLLQLQLQE